MKMRPEDLAGLPNYSGIFFDPQTGKTYREDGTDTGFTFERARWTGPFGIDFSWPWLNPISFATAETAQRVLAWAHDEPGVSGTGTRHRGFCARKNAGMEKGLSGRRDAESRRDGLHCEWAGREQAR